MTYPIFFSFEMQFPRRGNNLIPKLIHTPPTLLGSTYYSQRYTGIIWGPFRVGCVWKNP